MKGVRIRKVFPICAGRTQVRVNAVMRYCSCFGRENSHDFVF